MRHGRGLYDRCDQTNRTNLSPRANRAVLRMAAATIGSRRAIRQRRSERCLGRRTTRAGDSYVARGLVRELEPRWRPSIMRLRLPLVGPCSNGMRNASRYSLHRVAMRSPFACKSRLTRRGDCCECLNMQIGQWPLAVPAACVFALIAAAKAAAQTIYYRDASYKSQCRSERASSALPVRLSGR